MTNLDRRRARETLLTFADVDALLSYDPAAGIFRWKVDRSRRVRSGMLAGGIAGGYHTIEIANVKFRSHRIAWLLMTGTWPNNDIDHKDRNKTNNCFSNLREATRAHNCENKAYQLGSNPARGVHQIKNTGRWRAQSGTEYLGTFATVTDAIAARTSAAAATYGAFAQP